MKKIYFAFSLLVISQKLMCQQWTALGSDEQTSNSIALTAAPTFFSQVSNTAIPYVSYIDDVGNGNNLGDFKVHAKRFNNGQWEFAGDGISPSFPGSDDFPIALDGNTPYVAYIEAFLPVNLQTKLTVKRLNSNTNLWEAVGQPGLSDTTAGVPAIAASNSKIYVAYADGAAAGKITVKVYDNSNPGNGWQTVGIPGFSNGSMFKIRIVIDNGIPYVAYFDFTDGAPCVKKYNGTNWEDVGTNSPSGGVSVIISSLTFNSQHTPYIVYSESGGNGVMRNLNAANTWVTTGGQNFATNIDFITSMVLLNDIPFVAFGKKENGITQLRVKRLDATANNWPDAGTQPVTASATDVTEVALVKNGGTKLMLVFRNLTGGLYAKTFDAINVVPVTLVAFNAARQNNTTLLEWSTSSETGNKLFELQHSTDGINFSKIGEVQAKLPANLPHNYSAVHNAPVAGINYYRLKQVDINGGFRYSITITVSFNEELKVSISPNPVKDLLHVINLAAGEKEITIRDAAGKTIKRVHTNSTTVDINVMELSAGTYFLTIAKDNLQQTLSFIK